MAERSEVGFTDLMERVFGNPTGISKERLETLLSCLTKRERQAISMRFGLEGSRKSYGDVSQKLRLTDRHVRKLENRALEKLRAKSTEV